MISHLIFLLHISHLTCENFSGNESSTESAKHCRERNRLISTEKGDLYALIDATLGEKIILQCHYCEENDDARPRIWYEVDKLGLSEPKEVKLGMENNGTRNRIHVNNEHSLIINKFNYSDTGLYRCVGLEEQKLDEKFNYLIDLVAKQNTSAFETGNLTEWRMYYEDNFVPINKLFNKSLGLEYRYLREHLKLSMELKTDWGSWGECEVCGRPKDQGIKKHIGRCRIKIKEERNESVPLDVSAFTEHEIFLMNAVEISCKSLVIKSLVPGIFNSTRIIPDFIEIQPCDGICNPAPACKSKSGPSIPSTQFTFKDAEGINSGWKVGKSKSFKYRKTVVLPEKSHLTLVCPESTLDSKVIWRRNGLILKSGESVIPDEPKAEPRIIVDTFNTLYLVEVKVSEEGNYTCQVEDIKMQQVIIHVVATSRLLTRAFLRHLVYLGFVLSLTLTCYLAGLIIMCSRWHSFKSYQLLKEEDEEMKIRATNETEDEIDD